MRALVMADMEGITGIDHVEQITPFRDAEAYREGCRLMAGDVNAAAEGLLAGGAETVHARDMHLMGTNVCSEDLIPQVELMRDLPDDVLAEYDLVVLVGFHRRADNSGFLSHTLRPDMQVRINGEAVGEAELIAWSIGALGVPIAVLSGEQEALAQAKERLSGVLVVPTKVSLSKSLARCLPVEEVHAALRETCREAALRWPTFKPQRLAQPVSVEVIYGWKESAAMALEAGLGEWRGERTVGATFADLAAADAFLTQAIGYSLGMQLLRRWQELVDRPEAQEEALCQIVAYQDVWLVPPRGPWDE